MESCSTTPQLPGPVTVEEPPDEVGDESREQERQAAAKAANMKPRKKTSSLSGATATISTADATSPTALSPKPRSRVTFSCSGWMKAAIRSAQAM